MADDKRAIMPSELDSKISNAYWRSLAERIEVPDLHKAAAQEFPPGADEPSGVNRREWLKLLGASMALAGASGCKTSHADKIVPYVQTPRGVTPGIYRFYATSMELDGFATGLLVESHEGRPTKIEGNPQHPASLGTAGVHAQASVLDVYDPQRARAVRRGDRPEPWHAVAAELARERNDRGARLRFVLQPTGSPLI